MSEAPLLSVEELSVTMAGVPVLEEVSFAIAPGETLGLVGESGCGKSVTALSVMRLLPDPPGRVAGGRIVFDGKDMLTLGMSELRQIRGDRIGMIFQEPMTSLNPVFTIGDQIAESLVVHRGMSGSSAMEEAAKLLDLVGIPAARRQLGRYPHEMSGGQRQRVMIAIVLACKPKLLIADEPTTALDVTVQAQILDLLSGLVRDLNTAVVIVTHDLGVIARMCDRVIVLYGGRVMEEAPIDDLFESPRHPYAQGLMAATPRLDDDVAHDLRTIPGSPRALTGQTGGCPFAPRCERRIERCSTETPNLLRSANGRAAACHLVIP